MVHACNVREGTCFMSSPRAYVCFMVSVPLFNSRGFIKQNNNNNNNNNNDAREFRRRSCRPFLQYVHQPNVLSIVCSEETPSEDKFKDWDGTWDHNALQAYSTTFTVGAKKGTIPAIFAGNFLGRDADVVFDYRQAKTKALRNIVGDYYVPPVFMDRVVLHMTKNFLGSSVKGLKIPLILGIWGAKGEGKSFQVELCLKALGVEPVIMSAGELESAKAGEPAKLIRQRYLDAAAVIRGGKMCCLLINDLDAGIGRLGPRTQYTVNNQTLCAALMNICDSPTNVQMGDYLHRDCPRVPIIVTGNDFSTVYAPLVRDGRMDKFYWQPSIEDRVQVLHTMFKEDGLSLDEVRVLVTSFPNQSTDFFGAVRARIYDDQILKYVKEIGVGNLRKTLVNAKEPPPTFHPPELNLPKLLEMAEKAQEEHINVARIRLASEYIQDLR
mmetsp:Transcript_22248/g.37262  ORF Transcript_22248/g.37262 Transcript_22248/m.37262 type:complete len:439 (-) Transcript_22248:185-1501(-)